MSIHAACPYCQANFKAPDHAAGKVAKCPKCAQAIRLPASVTAPAPVQETPAPPRRHLPAPIERPTVPDDNPFAVDEVIHTPAPMPVQRHAPQQDGYKACPFCGETILGVAKKCKHCGETVDVSLRVAEEARRSAENTGRGGGSAAAAASTTVVVQGHHAAPFPHGLHLLITVLTCGFWLPVWIIAALLHR